MGTRRVALEVEMSGRNGLQELDESDYWLELIQCSGMVAPGRIAPLRTETQELIGIFTSSVLTAKRTRNDKMRLH